MNRQTRAKIDDRLLQRVCGEFLEMPGLRLTSKQAQRLWGLEEPTCRELLEYLVGAKFLRPAGPGMYARTSDGVADCPCLRVAGTDSHDRTAEPVKETS
jgi:hypothetical protein